MTITEMRVHMDCPGCESKVKKALRKLKGVDNVEIDMGMQKVIVTGWAERKKVLKTVRKTGRRAEFWQFPHNPEYHNLSYCTTSQYYHAPQPSSSYNYYKHGYDYGHDRGYYHHSAPYSTIFGHQTGAAFSDDNPHGCSVM